MLGSLRFQAHLHNAITIGVLVLSPLAPRVMKQDLCVGPEEQGLEVGFNFLVKLASQDKYRGISRAGTTTPISGGAQSTLALPCAGCCLWYQLAQLDSVTFGATARSWG